jgi:hypothetical protein
MRFSRRPTQISRRRLHMHARSLSINIQAQPMLDSSAGITRGAKSFLSYLSSATSSTSILESRSQSLAYICQQLRYATSVALNNRYCRDYVERHFYHRLGSGREDVTASISHSVPISQSRSSGNSLSISRRASRNKLIVARHLLILGRLRYRNRSMWLARDFVFAAWIVAG